MPCGKVQGVDEDIGRFILRGEEPPALRPVHRHVRKYDERFIGVIELIRVVRRGAVATSAPSLERVALPPLDRKMRVAPAGGQVSNLPLGIPI